MISALASITRRTVAGSEVRTISPNRSACSVFWSAGLFGMKPPALLRALALQLLLGSLKQPNAPAGLGWAPCIVDLTAKLSGNDHLKLDFGGRFRRHGCGIQYGRAASRNNAFDVLFGSERRRCLTGRFL